MRRLERSKFRNCMKMKRLIKIRNWIESQNPYPFTRVRRMPYELFPHVVVAAVYILYTYSLYPPFLISPTPSEKARWLSRQAPKPSRSLLVWHTLYLYRPGLFLTCDFKTPSELRICFSLKRISSSPSSRIRSNTRSKHDVVCSGMSMSHASRRNQFLSAEPAQPQRQEYQSARLLWWGV